MKFGVAARLAREKKKLGLKEAADQLHVARQTLYNMEKGITMPDSQNVLNMASLYGEPALLNIHCKQNCPIGCRMNYLLPNKITRDITAITVRNMKESEEHVQCLKEFAYLSVTRRDSREVLKYLKQILEAEYWIEAWKEQFMREYGIEALEEAIREVNSSYLDEGLVYA